MSIAESLLPEFDQEMAATRRLLERTPETQAAWKPHAKSTPLGQLAVHIAMLPGWTIMTLQQTELDLNPPGGPGFTMPAFQSTAALLALFDEGVKGARAAIAATSDRDFMVFWTLKNSGATVLTLPRVAVVRSFVLNHLIHHRGQYDVYLRLRDVPLPQLYGPTADEPM
ncbi:MAG: DinB family protein [Gemmatimonadales bacterium]